MTARARFRQSDMERALKAWENRVGKPPAAVRVSPDGTFTLLTEEQAAETSLSPLEQWEQEHGDRAA